MSYCFDIDYSFNFVSYIERMCSSEGLIPAISKLISDEEVHIMPLVN